jgi:nicotinamidase-related amidase
MQALVVVDAQNEFSAAGLRAVPNHQSALEAIRSHVEVARAESRPIAWIQHHNKPSESRAFVPGSSGAELSPGLGPQPGRSSERLFVKDVFGAFSTTGLEAWLRSRDVNHVLLVVFYAHICVSTSAREALIRGFDVSIDSAATGARELEEPGVGQQSAEEVQRTALLHLAHMGVRILAPSVSAGTR